VPEGAEEGEVMLTVGAPTMSLPGAISHPIQFVASAPVRFGYNDRLDGTVGGEYVVNPANTWSPIVDMEQVRLRIDAPSGTCDVDWWPKAMARPKLDLRHIGSK
jgi:hypothetical protein